MDTYEEFLKERIACLRLKKGVSARDMSLSIGQSENYINIIENGHAMPSMTAFFFICEYFEISPKEFFDSDQRNPSLINKILTELQKLNDIQLELIFALLKNFKSTM